MSEIKAWIIEKVSKIGGRPILIENLVLGNVKWGEFIEVFGDDFEAERIE